MDKEFIMQMRPWLGEEEKKAINSYMETDGFLTEFKKTEEFANEIAKFTSSKHCIVVNNGTISLSLGALALGIGPGDEVIVPNYTMIATPNSIKFIGGEPVFVDVEPSTLCLELNELEKRLNSKTKAVILVTANGRFPEKDIGDYLEFCDKNNLFLIEDAAQSLGSFYPDKTHIGLKGAIGSLSFSMPKIITTGQGGALITNDDELAFKLRRLKDFGRAQGGQDYHHSIGFNSKFTELQAVIGLEQLKKINLRIQRKKEIWLRYKDNLKELKQIKLFEHNLDYTAPWFIDCLCENRDSLLQFLKDKSIGSRVMYPPLNEQPCYKKDGVFQVSKEVGNKGLWLPSFTQLSNDQIDFITNQIKDFYS